MYVCMYACVCVCVRACVRACVCVFRNPNCYTPHYLIVLSCTGRYLANMSDTFLTGSFQGAHVGECVVDTLSVHLFHLRHHYGNCAY